MGAVAGGDREETQIRPTIFRATDKIREEYPYRFTPEIVSIGPYHRNRPSLQPMETTKLRRLLSLITRNHQPNTLDRYLLAVPVEGAQRQYNKRDNPSIPSATELRKCGIVFEVDTDAHMLDIKFNLNRGILTLPFFVMTDRMASQFLNLMMFEQGCPSVGNYFTSFITFMAGLIAGPEDARYLKKIGMIDNMLGGDDALARFFNDLGKHAHVDSASHYLPPLCNSLISYCSLDHHRCRAAIFSEYYNIPLLTKYFWSVIHFCVAISLLVSILQSHNSIFNYWFPRS